MKRRKHTTRAKKVRISEILTDSSTASTELHGSKPTPHVKVQRKLLNELADLRTRFSGMVSRGPVPFIVFDSDGYIREANESACRLLGYESKKLIYLLFTYLVAPQDLELFKQHLRLCRRNGTDPAITELRLRTADRRLVPVQLISNFIRRHGADQYQTAIVDQTVNRQRSKELKDARDFAENIVQTIRHPLVVLDEDMQVVTVNHAFSRVFGMVEGAGAKRFIQKFLDVRVEDEALRDMFATALTTREPVEDIQVKLPVASTPVPANHRDVPRTLLISARPFFRQTKQVALLLVSIEDITKQQQAEAALRREQVMLARAEALAHVGGWEWRLRENELNWSTELYNIFGVDRKTFRPSYTSYLELVHPEDREMVDTIIRKGISTGRAIDFQHRILRHGESRILHCQGYFAFDAHGNATVLMGIAQDVTELRKAEEQLRSMNRELEERSRSLLRSNEEMQAFSYSIAHDLRAPLRAIQGMSRILMEDYAKILDEDGQDYFSRIMDAAQRMDDLIRDLLDYARMTTVQLPIGPVDCESVWSRVLANFSTEVKDKKAVLIKEEAFPSVEAHRTVVELALNNLLGNALKFFPKGGHPEIRVWTEQVGDNQIRFNIQDKGIGIAPEHQQRIFRVFERLHPADAFPGTGIGLAIVKKGIERLGGAVGLTSTPDEGSTFWFELPAAN